MRALSMSSGRVVASLMLAAFLLPSALLPATGRLSRATDCPFQHDAAPANAVAAPSDEPCEHSAPTSCLILACGIAAPAIRSVVTLRVPVAGVILLQVGAVQQFVDLYRTGPPTPPPNQI